MPPTSLSAALQCLKFAQDIAEYRVKFLAIGVEDFAKKEFELLVANGKQIVPFFSLIEYVHLYGGWHLVENLRVGFEEFLGIPRVFCELSALLGAQICASTTTAAASTAATSTPSALCVNI